MTLSSTSRSSKPLCHLILLSIYILIFVLPLFGSERLLAETHWRLDQSIAEDINVENLRQSFGPIRSGEDLERLLIHLSKTHPFGELKIVQEADEWIVKGEIRPAIKEIRVRYANQLLDENFSYLFGRFIGKADSPVLRESLISHIKLRLSDLGYTNQQISVQEDLSDKKLTLTLDIELAPPCVIRALQLPQGVDSKTFEFKKGDICNRSDIEDGVQRARERLSQDGYGTTTLALGSMSYSPERKHMDIEIVGQLGPRSTYSVRYHDQEIFSVFEESFDVRSYSGLSPETFESELLYFFRSQGYDEIKIMEHNISEKTPSWNHHEFLIDLGLQYFLSDVIFTGNLNVPASELKTASGFSLFSQSIPLNENAVTTIVSSIESLYTSLGFWDAKVVSFSIKKPPQSSAKAILRVSIREGKKRYLGRLSFSGNTRFEDQELIAALKPELNAPLSKTRVIQLEKDLHEFYLKNGFTYSSIESQLTTKVLKDHVLISIHLHVKERIQLKIGSISIAGLIETSKRVVERELTFKRGDVFDPEQISRSKSKLIGLGIFKSVRITPSDQALALKDSNNVDLVVQVQEGNAGSVIFGPGFDLDRGLRYSAEVSHKNIMGMGRQASVRVSVSEERNQSVINDPSDPDGQTLLGRKVSFGFSEPYLLSLPVRGRVAFSHQATADDIWKFSNSLELSLAHKPSDYLLGDQIQAFFRIRQQSDRGSQEQEESIIATGNSTIGSVGLRYVLDKRENLFWPTKGFYLRTEAEWARYFLLSDFKYFKWDITNNYYLHLWGRFVLAFGLSLTSYENIDRNSKTAIPVLPSTLRLKAGGINRVRGFEHELGPYVYSGDEQTPIGGTRRTIAKLELRYQLFEKFGLTAFIDNGNTFFSDEEITKFAKFYNEQASDTRVRRTIEDNIGYEYEELLTNPGYLWSRHYTSYGLSLNYLTPLGALKLAVALPFSEPKSKRCQEVGICFQRARDEDHWLKKYQVHLNIGGEF